jgi:hypothetical protein
MPAVLSNWSDMPVELAEGPARSTLSTVPDQRLVAGPSPAHLAARGLGLRARQRGAQKRAARVEARSNWSEDYGRESRVRCTERERVLTLLPAPAAQLELTCRVETGARAADSAAPAHHPATGTC